MDTHTAIAAKRFGLIMCLSTWAAISAALASPPPPGWSPPPLMQGKDLIVTWDGQPNRPLMVAWNNQSCNGTPYFVNGAAGSMTIPRKGLGRIPNEILAIPADQRYKPAFINTPENAEKISIVFEPIAGNQVWFWGVTPEDPCGRGDFSRPALPIRARLIHKASPGEDFCGVFVWNLALEPGEKHEIPFYFIPMYAAALESVAAEGFKKANDISSSVCHAYHGGECRFTLETNPRVWGKLHQIKFKLNKRFHRRFCPV